jgi:hypothetical protein
MTDDQVTNFFLWMDIRMSCTQSSSTIPLGTQAMKITAIFGEKYPSAEWSVFFHHVSESDLSYVYDGYLQWVYKGRRYILIQLKKPEDE